MHYYGCYALARSAGIAAPDAVVIATSSQYVDDHAFNDWILSDARTGEGVLGIATAHHPLEAGVRALARRIDDDDSRLVWVPFHFLPGNVGDSFADRMIAREDGVPANQMLDHYLHADTLAAHRDHALHLLGIGTHAYADTFAHYGFSGMPSPKNCVRADSISVTSVHDVGLLAYLSAKADEFKARWGEYPELGHGSVLTYPDRPYLNWSFSYADGTPSTRSNPTTFLNACSKIYQRFVAFASVYYTAPTRPQKSWDELQDAVRNILSTEGSADQRAACWQAALRAGTFGTPEESVIYDVENWNRIVEQFKAGSDPRAFLQSDPYRFFVAAEYHRSFVLKRLLPGVGLLVA
jgi:hypothetical protein